MVIRNFDLARDYDAAIALWQASGPGVHVGPSDTRAEIIKKLARDPDLFLVAEEAGQLIGTVIGGFDGRRGLVYHLAVSAAHRGQAIGTMLMEEVERRLTANGCRKCYLLVAADNLDVIPFYQKLGWAEMPVTLMGKELK